MGVNELLHIGEKVKTLRLKKGISLTEMARLLGISKTTYANYEADRRTMPMNILAMVSLILEKPMEFILEMQCDDPWINPFEYLDDAQKEKMLMHCYGVTQEQAIEHIKASKNKKPLFVGNQPKPQSPSKRLAELEFHLYEDELSIFKHYIKLNEIGKKEAAKRVEELTYIPKYTDPDNE